MNLDITYRARASGHEHQDTRPEREAADLFNGPHENMLLRLAQPLDPLDDMLVALALDRNRNRQPTEDQRRARVVVLCDGLQVGHVERARGLVEDVCEILGDEAVEALEGAESEDPVVGQLCGGAGGLAEVLLVAGCM